MSGLRDLSEALDWLRFHYADDRPVPTRLHDMETDRQGELGSPRYTARFLGYLYAEPNDERDGYYRAPMWRALTLLRPRRPIREHHPSPYALVLATIATGYDARSAWRRFELGDDAGEALVLMAIRSLWGIYTLAPEPRPSWVDKSQSQQMAEGAA